MGRNALSIEVHEGKGSHLTKAEKERRRQNQIEITEFDLKPDDFVKSDPRAHKEFKRLRKLYADINYVGSLDNHIINQYCMAVSELDDIIKLSKVIRAGVETAVEGGDTAEISMLTNKMLEVGVELRLKRAEILKFGDRLYLNPTARTKNLPQKEKPKKEKNLDMFG